MAIPRSKLPDLGKFRAAAGMKEARFNITPKVKPRLGTGQRFRALEGKLSRQGVSNPAGLAAAIGRKKYGKKRFGQLSANGRKKARISRAGVASGGKRRYL